jgi:hypothetical protein
MTRRLVVVLAVIAASLVAAVPAASAKGARDAVLRGPDVPNGGVAKLDGDQARQLALATSLYTPAVAHPKPAGDLGPRYLVTYNLMTGPNETRPVRQRLYPFATDGPVAHMVTGAKTGWFDVRYRALAALADVGVPIPRHLAIADWAMTRDNARRLEISYPPSWHAAPSTLTPVLADPVVPLAVGTSAMVPQKLGECDIVPQHAVEAVGPTDALVLVYVYQGMASWSSQMERPISFGPELPWHTGPVQCTDGNPDVTVRTLNFTDSSKHLSVMVVVGKDATPQRNAEVYAVLDSLRAS